MADKTQIDRLLDRWEAEREKGRELSLDDLCRDFPDLIDECEQRISKLKDMDWLILAEGDEDEFSYPCQRNCPTLP